MGGGSACRLFEPPPPSFRIGSTFVVSSVWLARLLKRALSWAILGTSSGHLGPSGGHFGAILGGLGAILGHLGESWGHLGESRGHLGAIFGGLGAILGPS